MEANILENENIPRYYARKLLSNAENKLRVIIEETLRKQLKCIDEDIVILTKVRLLDIFSPNSHRPDTHKLFNMVSQKHIDFIIADRDYNIICLVELDDDFHKRDDRKARDEFVDSIAKECNIPLYRIKEKIDKVTPESLVLISYCVLDYFAPTCIKCGAKMIAKRSHRVFNFGHWFYGCKNFDTKINCGYNISIE